MDLITIILFTVVLVAQIVLFALFFAEKRRSDRRHVAMLDYVDTSVDGSANCMGEEMAEFKECLKKEMEGRFCDIEKDVFDKMSTLTLDYSQAQTAANKVNDFASSLASIFDYDPIRAIQKGRNKEAS